MDALLNLRPVNNLNPDELLAEQAQFAQEFEDQGMLHGGNYDRYHAIEAEVKRRVKAFVPNKHHASMEMRTKQLEAALDAAIAVCRGMATRLETERPIAAEELTALADEWSELLGDDHG